MRIIVKFTPSEFKIIRNNQHIVNSYFNKCITDPDKPVDPNEKSKHDGPSDYNVSPLMGGILCPSEEKYKKEAVYPDGAFIVASFLDTKTMQLFITNAYKNPIFYKDMRLKSITILHEELRNGRNDFKLISPILIKKKKKHKDDPTEFLTLTENGFEEKVKSYLINKLTVISQNKNLNLNLSNFNIKFDFQNFNYVKNVYIGKNTSEVLVKNQANMCEFYIEADKKVIELLYNIGVGQSTGCGFGCIYLAKNKHLYVAN